VAWRLLWLLAVGCGRIDFDALAVGDATADIATAMTKSCAALASTCGPAGTSSCCESPVVTGGTFYRSYDLGSDAAYPDMTNPATVSTFRLDRFEISVGRFRQFVVAGMGTQERPPSAGDGAHPLIAQSGWDPAWNSNLVAKTSDLTAALSCDATATWTVSSGANETLPITCITWYEAAAFCAWDGGFLPTEAEWNYAAAGGSEQRAYPWSNPASSLTIDCSYADYAGSTGFCVPGAGITVLPVGTDSPRGDGVWGQSDLAGNVWELVLDWSGTYPLPCADCADLVTGTERGIRGGGAKVDASNQRVSLRASIVPTSRTAHMNQGARCARSP
jgi:formylglycine-generating enzyme required for sulfatase activity